MPDIFYIAVNNNNLIGWPVKGNILYQVFKVAFFYTFMTVFPQGMTAYMRYNKNRRSQRLFGG